MRLLITLLLCLLAFPAQADPIPNEYYIYEARRKAIYGVWRIRDTPDSIIIRESFGARDIHVTTMEAGGKPTPQTVLTQGKYFWVTHEMIVIIRPQPLRAEFWFVEITEDTTEMRWVSAGKDKKIVLYLYKEPELNNGPTNKTDAPTEDVSDPEKPQGRNGSGELRVVPIGQRPTNWG